MPNATFGAFAFHGIIPIHKLGEFVAGYDVVGEPIQVNDFSVHLVPPSQ